MWPGRWARGRVGSFAPGRGRKVNTRPTVGYRQSGVAVGLGRLDATAGRLRRVAGRRGNPYEPHMVFRYLRQSSSPGASVYSIVNFFDSFLSCIRC